MVKFKNLGFDNFDNFKKYFFDTLLISNKTYDYFVNWKKIKKNINKYIKEISLLNSLSKVHQKERENYFKELLLKYPEVIEVIPIIIAERINNKKICVFDLELQDILDFEFNKLNIDITKVEKILKFCRKTGILDLFQEVDDIYDYILGVEVGLDSNARKNRSGKIFQKMCYQKIIKIISTNIYTIIENDYKFSLYSYLNKRNKNKRKAKVHDFVIYKNSNPVAVIECSFYNVLGSKINAISESYIYMTQIADERGINFIWVTDGPAWINAENIILNSMKHIHYVLNYKMLDLIRNIF